ncbi:hypothetical protein [Geobacter sp.]|uniref:hypothetical protein n=1 Tax=Geobacter sp. TaxID=46610 RepID=UPI0027BAE71D|nr:hypothetical protein [Geobacter sp.]
MRKFIFILIAASLLSSCGDDSNSSQPTATTLYISMGSLQCTGGGTSLPELERQLTGAGVPIHSSSCGIDGQARAAVCGTPDGRIAIVEVPATQVAAALALGYAPLSDLPNATKVACQ